MQWVRPATHACDGSDLLAAQAARVCCADLSVSALKASGAHCSATAGRCTRTRGALRTGTAARKARTRTSRGAHRRHVWMIADYKEVLVNGNGKCTAEDMGGDPLEGVAKMCICIPGMAQMSTGAGASHQLVAESESKGRTAYSMQHAYTTHTR